MLTDVDATSGIQTRTFGTSIPVTIRKAITKLEAAGYTPASIVLTPADFETTELALSTTNAVEHISLPYDRRLSGVPIVVTTSQTAAVGHVLARDSVVVDTDHSGVGVQWSRIPTPTTGART